MHIENASFWISRGYRYVPGVLVETGVAKKAKMTPYVVALQSTRFFTKTQYSMTPKAVYFEVDNLP